MTHSVDPNTQSFMFKTCIDGKKYLWDHEKVRVEWKVKWGYKEDGFSSEGCYTPEIVERYLSRSWEVLEVLNEHPFKGITDSEMCKLIVLLDSLKDGLRDLDIEGTSFHKHEMGIIHAIVRLRKARRVVDWDKEALKFL